MIWVHLLILLIFVFLGSRLGGVGIGLAGGAGVLVLVATGLHTDAAKDVPWSVIGIIIPVICTIAALQVAGGMDYLVHLTEVLLRRHPKQITYLAPFVTFMLSLLCGTGHTAYSVIPVIVDVAKEHDVRPSRPLSIAVVASQVAVASSPISAATVAMTTVVEPMGIGYLQVLAVTIPTTFIGCAVGAVVASRQGKELKDDPIYQEREAKGLVSHSAAAAAPDFKPAPSAIPSLLIFLASLVVIVVWATISSKQLGIMSNPPINSSSAIMVIMMTTAAIICVLSRKPVSEVTTQSTFRAGMTAAICIMGVAWLGTTFFNNYMSQITTVGSSLLHQVPWLYAVILYFCAPLLFSHAATTAAFMPVAAKIGLTATTMLACYPAVANYYLLPNYPTTVAAIEMDDTGSTRVGRFVLNHPFVIPGTVSIAVAVALGFFWAPIVA
ncbi:anaerobic C4-dicarboxylate transporter [Propionibacterium freudenreichii]|uniref:anaerobic C4-dicarboxylate transporter n=1 Tax=Propionibacterium freudenreichii TaxID=1744 RepID=UPI0021A35397|nr:anaerobic C4-dicarboxylate transporter [Propionibacterium freudenreichii]MCT3013840.1 anaerobic C4-dicarboxylate transporter [Propionibacterium freudenreichii]MDK9302198.1 anaerobic C4-dicarboxylate transporter [Propionibacterium freudenreichii]MDK9340447.1 anaerobic C4-dicarboxylate transporter [Propionibacterium freudenreichii]MDK9612386.1 anaerobic C4-dicarboxylate transporter [Propionibacterium freudenreichii]MDK9621178.1 anaerobic C4-dicarboxylate transporter [Propionibacterium freuden